jgi:flagellar hook-length control protein FliK
MSVTIISTPPKPAQATTADKAASSTSGNDDTVTGPQNFASLLLGQLVSVVAETVAASPEKASLPEADAAPADTASLFAALGIVPPEQRMTANAAPVSDTHQPGTGKTEQTIADKLTALQTTDAAGKDLKAEMNTAPELAAIPATSDKPAKFAVSTLVASTTDPVVSKHVALEAQPNTLQALPTNTSGNANNIPLLREASLSVSTPIRDQNWAGDFAQKIVWLASSDRQSAQLTLNPPQMGPIEISLNIDKGSATASFVSASAEVRDAIETALPRLREMFASAGIALGQTNVSAQSFQQQASNGGENRGPSQWMADNAILVANSAGSLPSRAFSAQQGTGLVDIFA